MNTYLSYILKVLFQKNTLLSRTSGTDFLVDLPPWGPPIETQHGHHHSKIPSIIVYFEPSVIWAENGNPGAIEEVKSQNWPFFVFFSKNDPPWTDQK